MATRAQNFRAQEQRKRHEAPKAKKSRRVVDPQHTDTRNLAKRIEKTAVMALEDSMSGTPSRKSTRGSSHHGRPDHQLIRTARTKTFTAKSRAMRAQVER